MHSSVRERLESLLAARSTGAVDSLTTGHLAACTECATQVNIMRAHSHLLKNLHAPDEFEPAAGFYARVMQRIEQTAKRSIWWVFVYSPIGKRLAFASLSVALALGSYMVAAEGFDGHLTSPAAVVQSGHFDAPVTGTPEDQRQAVLVNFITHPEPSR